MLTGLYKQDAKFYTAIIIFLFCFISASAQKDPLKEGNKAFEEDHFREALIYYNQIDKIESSAPILFKRGVCYYEINQLDNAISDFQRAWEYGYKNPEVDYYTGLIQHNKGKFAIAADYYKKYLKEIDQDNFNRSRVVKLIKQCGRAIDLSYKTPLAIIEKLPGGINTAYDEVGLTESPTKKNRYYFTSNKPNTSTTLSASDYDVYWMTKENGKYSEPKRMKYVINKRDNEILLGFTPTADGLYFYRGKDHQGDIMVNSGSGDKARTKALGLPSIYSLVNSDVFFFDDHVILFASKEGQGYGGYDLYASIYEDRGWSKPINLGPEVNSEFDEISPFLSHDGSELYFSSNRNLSIGGHDIFVSRYLYEANKWESPQNMGIPINSPGDDTHFSLAYDGLTAMLSSNRKNSFGGMDNYVARFKDPRGLQDFGGNSLAFIDYEIPNRSGLELDEQLEIELSDTTVFREEVVAKLQDLESTTTSEESFSLTYEPIYYSSGLDLINEKNVDQIDALIDMMLRYPSMEVELDSHTTEDGILEYKLFSSLKVAERLEQYFVDKGISDKRIHIKGLADSYPIAIPERQGGDGTLEARYNSRIELKFSNYDDSKIILERNSPELPPYARDKKFALYSTLLEEAITYKIQIAVVGQMYRGRALDLFNDTMVEENDATGLYAYTIGLYDTYADALKVKRDMDRLGITDARVVVYYDGLRLTEDQYVYYVNDFPDLRSMMNYSE